MLRALFQGIGHTGEDFRKQPKYVPRMNARSMRRVMAQREVEMHKLQCRGKKKELKDLEKWEC